MPAKCHDEGENRALNILYGATPVDGIVYLGLYKNSVELGETATLLDLNEVAGFAYARKSLTRGSWTIVASVATYAEQTFQAVGGDWGEVTGYFIASSLDNTGKLLYSEHFTSALDVDDGKGIKITPKITAA